MSREYTRRQVIDHALNLTKNVAIGGGLIAFMNMFPGRELARKLLGNGDAPPHYVAKLLEDWDIRAEAATLPLNYVVTAGTVPTGGNFANGIAELTTNSGSGGSGAAASSATDNTDATLIKNGGTKNIRIDLVGDGGANRNHDTRCTLTALAMDAFPTIGLRLYTTTALASFLYDWSNNSGDTNAFRMLHPQHPSDTIISGWHYLQWHRDESSTLASGNWLTDFVLTRFQATTGSGSTNMVILDQQYYGGYQHPVIPWILEGGFDSHYTTGFGVWQGKGLQGTLAINTSLIDTSPGTYLTTAMIDEMYAAGWDVIHASDTTTALTGLTVQQVTDRLGTADAFLRSKGWTRTLGWCALPGGAFGSHRSDANAITALTNLSYRGALDKFQDGATSATNVSPYGIDPIWGIANNPYRIPTWRAQNPDTLAEHTVHVGHAIAAGGPRILRSGSIVTGAASGDIETADHASLVNTLALKHHAGTLSCVPWRKFASGMNGRMVRP